MLVKNRLIIFSLRTFSIILIFLWTLSGKVFSEKIPDTKLSKEIIEQWMEKISNKGRWGKKDQLGTLNLITPAKQKQAATLIKNGISISLSHEIIKNPDSYNPWPLMHSMHISQIGDEIFAGDIFTLAYHGYSHSHIDALSHLFYKGSAYNGFSHNILTSGGMDKLGIELMKDGIVTRGVLIDLPELRGVPYLDLDEVITINDLTSWEEKTGTTVESGDVLLIRTGRWSRQRKQGSWNARSKLAGLHPSVALWLKNRDVAALGSDGVSDAFPSRIEGIEDPVHLLTLVALGMPLFDNLDLETLSEQAKKFNRWEFMFFAAPLRIPGGTGSPVNPIATF